MYGRNAEGISPEDDCIRSISRLCSLRKTGCKMGFGRHTVPNGGYYIDSSAGIGGNKTFYQGRDDQADENRGIYREHGSGKYCK